MAVPAAPIQFAEYTLLELVARGGMAEIYRAQVRGAAGFRREVAVKKLLPQFSQDPHFVSMLIDEANIAAQLVHPNIVQVFNCGNQDGNYYLVYEFIRGYALRRMLTHLDETAGAFTGPEVALVGMGLLRGLHSAHTLRGSDDKPLGIVHRDVSPENILVSQLGEVKLTDFGIAQAMGRRTDTGVGIIKGKLRYMAPEQAAGAAVEAYADQYAAALTLVELLVGKPLVEAKTPDAMLTLASKGVTAAFDRLDRSHWPVGMEQVLRRALMIDPKERYNDCEAFADALSHLCLPAELRAAQGDLAERVRRIPVEDAGASGSATRQVVTLAAPNPTAAEKSAPWARVAVVASIACLLAGGVAWRLHSEPLPTPVVSRPAPVLTAIHSAMAPMGTIAVRGAAPGTFIFVDGSVGGVASSKGSADILVRGEVPHGLRVQGADGIPHEQRLTVANGQVTEMALSAATAAPPSKPVEPGRLAVNCHGACRVFLDGASESKVATQHLLNATPGTHTVKACRASQRGCQSKSVTVYVGKLSSTRFKL